MRHYPEYIRYFAVVLAAFYALADGHLLCAPCLDAPQSQQAEHPCGHSHHSILTATCCVGDSHGKLPCVGNDLSAIISNCSVELLNVESTGFVAATEWRPQSAGQANAVPVSSLRLHLLYRVLLI